MPPNSVCYWKKVEFGTHLQSKFLKVPSSSNYLFTGLSALALSEGPDSQQSQLAHGSTLQPQQGWLRALHLAGRLWSSRALSPVTGSVTARSRKAFPRSPRELGTWPRELPPPVKQYPWKNMLTGHVQECQSLP